MKAYIRSISAISSNGCRSSFDMAFHWSAICRCASTKVTPLLINSGRCLCEGHTRRYQQDGIEIFVTRTVDKAHRTTKKYRCKTSADTTRMTAFARCTISWSECQNHRLVQYGTNYERPIMRRSSPIEVTGNKSHSSRDITHNNTRA